MVIQKILASSVQLVLYARRHGMRRYATPLWGCSCIPPGDISKDVGRNIDIVDYSRYT